MTSSEATRPPGPVLMLGAYPPPLHGASRVASLLECALLSADVDVRVFSTSASLGRRVDMAKVSGHLRGILAVATARRHVGTIVYQTGAGGTGLWYQVIVAFLARFRGLPSVFHHHSYAYLNSKNLAMRALARAGGRRMKHLVLSSTMASRLRTEYSPARVCVVSNAAVLGPGRIERRPDRLGGPIRLGHFGNLSAEKGILVFLDMATALRRGGLNLEIRIAGPAANDRVVEILQSHISQYPQDEWLGPIAPDDVPAFMRSLDCFVFPSSYVNEALPLVVLEALREGTPVVTSPVGCLVELLQNERWLAEPNAQATADAVLEVLSDTDACRRAADLYADVYGAGSIDVLVKEVLAG